ncbi:isopentenyl transferase family protein [Streptomyces sp. NPDC057257]|uniref:isopentenyl transferase family protein n=1 Tax=Streptomyces sp. NPDC057257 TaxID=3346071 RepID=UPI00362FC162
MSSTGSFSVHLIAGPTGTGKSRAATDLARRTGATVVVADRLQCFAEIATTSARAGADVPGVRRVWLCDRAVADGDYPAAEAVNALVGHVQQIHASGVPVIVEGGSISLLTLLADRLHDLPWTVTPTVLTRPADPGRYLSDLTARAAEMLRPASPQPSLLRELSTLWKDPANRWFVASVNGFEAALEWSAKHSLSPESATAKNIPCRLMDELSRMIAERHAEHGADQEKAFRHMFSRPVSGAAPVRAA